MAKELSTKWEICRKNRFLVKSYSSEGVEDWLTEATLQFTPNTPTFIRPFGCPRLDDQSFDWVVYLYVDNVREMMYDWIEKEDKRKIVVEQLGPALDDDVVLRQVFEGCQLAFVHLSENDAKSKGELMTARFHVIYSKSYFEKPEVLPIS